MQTFQLYEVGKISCHKKILYQNLQILEMYNWDVWLTSKQITSNKINADKYSDFMINADKTINSMFNNENT